MTVLSLIDRTVAVSRGTPDATVQIEPRSTTQPPTRYGSEARLGPNHLPRVVLEEDGAASVKTGDPPLVHNYGASGPHESTRTAMATEQKHPLELPENFSPDDIAVIPELREVLKRLQPPQSSTTLSGAPGVAAAAPSVTGTTPLPTSLGGGAGGLHGAAGGGAAAASGGGPITTKEFPAATDPIKHKLQRARRTIKELPDMARTIEEQDEEVRELQTRLAAQLAMLEKIKQMGLDFAKEQQQEDRMET